jgi:aminopeptidase
LDPRVKKHAKWLVNYCTATKPGDNVLIRLGGAHYAGDAEGLELATEVFKEAGHVGAKPLIFILPGEAARGYIEQAADGTLATTPKSYFELVKASDVVIGIESEKDTKYLKGIDSRRIGQFLVGLRPITDEMLKKRWTGTLHPTAAHAKDAGMSVERYKKFVYSAMLRDWDSEIKRMVRLKEIMDRTSEVQLVGKDTDLSFSIKGRTTVVDDAKYNFPGGEVFTAPLDDSATGKIYFDLPSIWAGQEAKDVRLTFDKGVIVDYSASKNESFLKDMIDTDEGSKRLGEFGIGTNRGINRFTRNILFDEKMANTIHLAIGEAYEMCGGINKSAIHWDLIKTMKPGKMKMDGETIQEDGKFVWELGKRSTASS